MRAEEDPESANTVVNKLTEYEMKELISKGGGAHLGF
jgi:hypothetical protein